MKKAFCVLIAAVMLISFAGCNRQIIDVTYKYDRAIVSLPDGTIVSGKVSSWKDFEDGDQIQVVIDGVTYLVHSSQVALIND